MDRYETLKNKAKARLKAKIQEAKNEYRAALDGIESVRKLEMVDDEGQPVGTARRSTGLTEMVRKAVEVHEGRITSELVYGKIREFGVEAQRPSVASALKRIAIEENSGLEVVVEAAGRRAGVYQKKSEIKEESADNPHNVKVSWE